MPNKDLAQTPSIAKKHFFHFSFPPCDFCFFFTSHSFLWLCSFFVVSHSLHKLSQKSVLCFPLCPQFPLLVILFVFHFTCIMNFTMKIRKQFIFWSKLEENEGCITFFKKLWFWEKIVTKLFVLNLQSPILKWELTSFIKFGIANLRNW